MAQRNPYGGPTRKQVQKQEAAVRRAIKAEDAAIKKDMIAQELQMKKMQTAQENMARYGVSNPTEAQKRVVHDREAKMCRDAQAAQNRLAKTGSALVGKSLDKIFGGAAHLPAVDTKEFGRVPLYLRTEGSTQDIQKLNAALAVRDGHGQAYNSPRNIRLVYLGHTHAHIGCWASTIGVDGRPKNTTYLSKPYADKFVLQAGKYNFTNAGFSFMTEPQMQNLEEIWISADAFSGVEYQGIYQQVKSVAPGTAMQSPQIAQQIIQVLQKELGGDFRAVYPLLRCVVIVVQQQFPDGTYPLDAAISAITNRKQRINGKEVDTVLKEAYPRTRVSIPECKELMDNLARSVAGVGYVVCPIPGANVLAFTPTGKGAASYRFDARLKIVAAEIKKIYGAEAPEQIKTDGNTKTLKEKEYEVECQAVMDSVMKVLEPLDFTVSKPLSATDGNSFNSTCGFHLNSPAGNKIAVSYSPSTWKGLVEGGRPTRKLNVSGSRENEKTANGYGQKLAAAVKAVSTGGEMKDGVGDNLLPEGEMSKETTQGDGVSLESIIKSMESSDMSSADIKKALWAYKQAHPDYFKAQLPKLSKPVLSKYADALN